VNENGRKVDTMKIFNYTYLTPTVLGLDRRFTKINGSDELYSQEEMSIMYFLRSSSYGFFFISFLSSFLAFEYNCSYRNEK